MPFVNLFSTSKKAFKLFGVQFNSRIDVDWQTEDYEEMSTRFTLKRISGHLYSQLHPVMVKFELHRLGYQMVGFQVANGTKVWCMHKPTSKVIDMSKGKPAPYVFVESLIKVKLKSSSVQVNALFMGLTGCERRCSKVLNFLENQGYYLLFMASDKKTIFWQMSCDSTNCHSFNRHDLLHVVY